MFAGFCNEIQSFVSPGGLERDMAGKQMDRTGDAPVAVLWDVAFIPPAFQIFQGFGRHQSKYVSSFCAWFSGCHCHIHLWIQSFSSLESKKSKDSCSDKTDINDLIVFGKSDRTGVQFTFV